MEFKKDELKIVYGKNEEIEFKVTAIGTVHQVSYDVGYGRRFLEPNETLRIGSASEISRVDLFFIYSDSEGGRYTIDIAGSSGGIFSLIVLQIAGTSVRPLTFALEGDDDVTLPAPTEQPERAEAERAVSSVDDDAMEALEGNDDVTLP